MDKSLQNDQCPAELKKRIKRLENTREKFKNRLYDRRKKIQYLMVTVSDLEKSREKWKRKSEESEKKLREKENLLHAKDLELEQMKKKLMASEKVEDQLITQLKGATQMISRHHEELLEFKKKLAK